MLTVHATIEEELFYPAARDGSTTTRCSTSRGRAPKCEGLDRADSGVRPDRCVV
jgi:hypothetical protein